MKKSAAKPYSGTRLVKFLEKRILELRPRKTQSQIAVEAGFTQANMLAMIKSGANKLPLDRVPGLAKVSITTESGPGFFAQKGPRFRVLKGPAGEHPIGRSWSGLHSLIGCG